VLAEAEVLESGTCAFPAKCLAFTDQSDAIVLRPRDLCEHPPGPDREELDPPVTVIRLATREGCAGDPL